MKKKPIRTKSGQFRSWPGGAKRKGNTHHGSMSRLGKGWKRQHPTKKAKVGDVVRDRNKDGSYNKGSPWYVKTLFGWRPVKRKKGR